MKSRQRRPLEMGWARSIRPKTVLVDGAVETVRRDPWLDNVRAILITLVVIGHTIEDLNGRAADSLYTWIYSFHMAAFVFVSGYLSRSYVGNARQARSLVATLLVPYVLFRGVHEVERWLGTGAVSTNLFMPSYALWFLIALFVWRLITPVLRTIRFPMTIVLLLFFIVPFDDSIGSFFSLGRIFGFLPFFVLGLVVEPWHLDWLRTSKAKIAGWCVLVAGLIIAVPASVIVPRLALYMRGPYSELGAGWSHGIVFRLMALLTGIVGAAAILAITPRAAGRWTQIGRNSLAVYLLQAAILYPVKLHGYLDDYGGWAVTLLAVAFSVALTFVLGSRLVDRLTRWFIRPRLGWLLSPDPLRS